MDEVVCIMMKSRSGRLLLLSSLQSHHSKPTWRCVVGSLCFGSSVQPRFLTWVLLIAEIFHAFNNYIVELAELYRRIMAQLVASIAVSGRMPCHARCLGYTKMMSTDASYAFRKNTRCFGMRINGNVHRLFTRDTSIPLTCRAVCGFCVIIETVCLHR